jgi:hypothetical protein
VSSTAPRGANPLVKRAILAVGIVVLLGAIGYQIYRLQQPSRGGDPHTDLPQLAAVQTFDYVGGDHTTDPVTYTQTPPAGGPHDPAWEDCGVYTEPIRNENAVHALEHGTLWVTYQPGLSQSGIAKLETALGTVKSKKTILSPYDGLPSQVVVTVWNAQLDLTGPNDPRLTVFLGFYGDGHTAPEASIASCAGGVHNLASADNP